MVAPQITPSFWLIVYLAGFAGMLCILGILQIMKVEEGDDVAPPRVWPWFIATAAAWPLLLAQQ